MKTLMKMTKKRRKEFLKTILSFLAIMILWVTNVLAQDVSNIKNSLSSATASIKAEQERIAFQEKMSYVFMGVAFALVLAIAWFSTVYFSKRSKKAKEELLQQRQIVKPNLSRSSASKRYGTHGGRR